MKQEYITEEGSWHSYITHGSNIIVLFNESAAEKLENYPGIYDICAILSISSDNNTSLPDDNEIEKMLVIEDEFELFLKKSGGILVGRTTFPGGRDIYGYLSKLQMWEKDFCPSDPSLTNVSFKLVDDSDYNAYFNFLYPNEEEWRCIKDNNLLRVLEQENDNTEIPREIEHFLYFSTYISQENCAKFMLKEGFKIGEKEKLEDSYSMIISHIEAPSSISKTTIFLLQKIKEFEGEYDGWETYIIPKDENLI